MTPLQRDQARGGIAPVSSPSRVPAVPAAPASSAHLVPPVARTALAALRAPQWWYFALLPAASMEPFSTAAFASNQRSRLSLAVVTAALCLAYAYGINAIEDRTNDGDKKKNPLAGMEKLPTHVFVTVVACAVLALVTSALLGPASVAAASISLCSATAYSTGPRCKSLPVIGTAVNATIFTPLLFLGQRHATLPPTLHLLTVTFVALLTQNQLVHEMADRKEDMAARVRTTAVTFGTTVTSTIALSIGLVAAPTLALRHQNLPGFVAAAAVVAAGLLAAIPRPDRARQTRIAHRWFALISGATVFLTTMYGEGRT